MISPRWFNTQPSLFLLSVSVRTFFLPGLKFPPQPISPSASHCAASPNPALLGPTLLPTERQPGVVLRCASPPPLWSEITLLTLKRLLKRAWVLQIRHFPNEADWVFFCLQLETKQRQTQTALLKVKKDGGDGGRCGDGEDGGGYYHTDYTGV